MFLPATSSTSTNRPSARRSVASLIHIVWARLRQLSLRRPALVFHHTASMRSKCSSAADPRPANERSRDINSTAASLFKSVRWLASGLQAMHHDGFNPRRTVSSVSRRRDWRRQAVTVKRAFCGNRQLQLQSASGVFLHWSTRVERSSLSAPEHCRL
jgi:hypothetical protein